ncbi:MAG TPA: efflux RND transporter periplasmic adaptor subunit [Chitinophagaceae bacterium]|nr:efflux RND transporter periplasmic adaptor subunit [Chitinophagaceae bacterium]
MKKNSIARVIIIILIVIIALALAFNKRSKDKKAEKEVVVAASGSRDLLVDVFVAKPVPVTNAISATGSLMGNEAVDLQPQVSGLVTGIFFQEGGFVRKGQVLITLFDADLKAQLEKSRMALQLSNLTLQREEKLLSVNGVSQQGVDNARNLVQSNQADIDNIEAQISKTQIIAPFSGIIGLRNISVGATVAPTTVIASLNQTDPLKMDFSVPEKYGNSLRLGDTVSFAVAEVPDRLFSGKIYAIEPDIDPTTRTVRLRALVSNPRGELHPGSFAAVKLQLKNIPDALMIPTEAIMQTTRDKQVVVIRNRRANLVNVETGVENANQIQITKGLSAYDTVAITGIMQVKNGTPVRFLSIQ